MQAYHQLYHDTIKTHLRHFTIMESYLSKNGIQLVLTQAQVDRLAARQTTQALIIFQDQGRGIWELQKVVATQSQSLYPQMASSLTTGRHFLAWYNPKPSKAVNSSVAVLLRRQAHSAIAITMVRAWSGKPVKDHFPACYTYHLPVQEHCLASCGDGHTVRVPPI